MASIYNLPVQKTGTPVRAPRRLAIPGEDEVKEVAARVFGEGEEGASVSTPRGVPLAVVEVAVKETGEEGAVVEGQTTTETRFEDEEVVDLGDFSIGKTISSLKALLDKLYQEGNGVRGIGGPKGVEQRIQLKHGLQKLMEALSLSPGESKEIMESPDLQGLMHSLRGLSAEYDDYQRWGKIENWQASYYRSDICPLFEEGKRLLVLLERFQIAKGDMFSYQLQSLEKACNYRYTGVDIYFNTGESLIRVLEKFAKESLTDEQARALANRFKQVVERLIKILSKQILIIENDCRLEINYLARDSKRSGTRLRDLQQQLQGYQDLVAANEKLAKLFPAQ